MAEEDEKVRIKSTIVYAPSDAEYEELYLRLAGDNPSRRAAVLYWMNSRHDGIGKEGMISLIVNSIDDDHFEAIHCEDMELRPEHLEKLSLFPEISRLEFVRTPLSNEILSIIAQHKALRFLSSTEAPSLDNQICEVAAQLPNLEILTLDSQRIDDRGVKFLARHPSLISLEIDGTSITPAASQEISKLRNLQSLRISNCTFDDEAMRDVAKLSELRWLQLANARITDAGVAHLRTLKNLVSLSLNGTQVTDRSAEYIADFEKLFQVHLDDTQVSNKAVSLLTALPRFGDLSLRNTLVDDQCVPDLLKIRKLHTLDIRGTKISREGAERIKVASRKHAILQSDHEDLLRKP